MISPSVFNFPRDLANVRPLMNEKMFDPSIESTRITLKNKTGIVVGKANSS